jgi:4-amino-4-deoxy-L-arabinose transferase-like glycosyltransferase
VSAFAARARAGPALAQRATLGNALVVAGVLAGVALRIWILLSSQGALDSDEAVWGLMARHFEHGEFSTFFWGQPYGGTQEVILTVPLFWILGASATALKTVPIVLWALSALLVWRIGRRTLDETRARIAALVFWTWPAFFLWKSTKAHGFYGSGLVFGLAAVLLALRLRERDSPFDYALLGLMLGLGWWATPQIAILALPAVVWLVWSRPHTLRGAWLATPAFLLGSLPWWLFNIRHHWPSLTLGADESSKFTHLHNLFTATLPTALGLRLPYSLAWLPTIEVAAPLYALLLAGFLYLLWRRPAGLDLLLLTALIFPILYTVSSYTSLNTEPRYETLAYPVFTLLLVYAASSRLRAGALVVVALALAAAGVAEMQQHNLSASHDGAKVPADIHPLLRTLRAHGIDRVYANYWVAYRITFESSEQIIAAPADQPRYGVNNGRVAPLTQGDPGAEGRYPKYYEIVARSRQAAHVFVVGENSEPRARRVLLPHGYRLLHSEHFDVYLPPTP